MTTPISRGEGLIHLATMQSSGILPMAFANFTEVEDPRLGAFAPLCYKTPAQDRTREAAKAIVKLFLSQDQSQRTLDVSGWMPRRSLVLNQPYSECTQTDLLMGIQSGCFPCEGEIARAGPLCKMLRDAGMLPTYWYSDSEAKPDGIQPGYEGVYDTMKRLGVTGFELQRLTQIAQLKQLQTIVQAVGGNPANVILSGVAAVDQGLIKAVDCPISHIAAGSFTPGTNNWSDHWGQIRRRLDALQATRRRTWLLLNADMPPEQAAFGAGFASHYPVVKATVCWCNNKFDASALAPKIRAFALATAQGEGQA